ncbi:PAS domain S-box-containing protein [Paucimonas lemoignei]|uniref:histidine kinase n=1 Tax=Paucimonas lemoignei TaxID=29443 RepID=A0A4V2UJ19_PAULE|nr:ATP-binding protein [Paucimonas lemoignei]TCS38330.1 PAS domain S-box-containing protein [Paucimonas lemoignei]
MFLAWGKELCFLYNDAYVEILGAKHPWALGRRFQEIWSEIWQDLLPLIDKALAGEAVYHENLPLTMHRHGYDEPVWFTFSYSPVRDDNGTIAGMYCACVETTEQVLAEAYRNEENERFRTLFEQAPGFMAILRGKNYVFDLTNQAYSQLVGHRDILGKPAREALPEVVEQGFIALLDHVYTTGQTYVGHAMPVELQREPNGPLEKRFLDFVYQPIRDARGVVTGIFAEGSDVTERKQAEEELRQLAADLSKANQRQSEFLATLAHELRNPLAPIRTGLDLMRVSADNPASTVRIREMMDRQLDHLVHLVDDLLDVARISTGKIEPKKARVLLKDIVLSAVETTLPGIQAKNQDFSVHIPDEPIWLIADANRLAQVIGNVLTNARKYTPDNGKIDLSVRRKSDEVVIVVADNGIGIPADSLPHIFDIFTQVGHDSSHAQGGLGIGLSLVKRLIEKHSGTVHAFSAGPGQGATFTIRLPIAPAEAEPSTAAKVDDNAMPVEQRPMRILIADDNQDAADLLKEMLEIQGHMVRIANDGMSALELAKTFLPDMALLDIGMPVMDGYKLAMAIRQAPQLRSTRLAAITGWGAKEDRDRTREAGFDYHLTKPVSFEALKGLLRDVQSAEQVPAGKRNGS